MSVGQLDSVIAAAPGPPPLRLPPLTYTSGAFQPKFSSFTSFLSFSSSSHLPLHLFVAFLPLVFSDCPLLFYPHSLNSRVLENDWQIHLTRQASDSLINLLLQCLSPWQRSDWLGLPTSCALSQTVIWGCFEGIRVGGCACVVSFLSNVCFLWISGELVLHSF